MGGQCHFLFGGLLAYRELGHLITKLGVLFAKTRERRNQGVGLFGKQLQISIHAANGIKPSERRIITAMNWRRLLGIGLMGVLGAGAAMGQGLLQKAQPSAPQSVSASPKLGLVRAGELQAALLAEKTAVMPGESIMLGLRLLHDPHWHTYWRNPGDSGLATSLQWQMPAGWRAGDIQWPTPRRLPVGPLANFGYEGDVLLSVPVSVPKNAVPGESVLISARASWLVCKDVCIPGEALLGIRLRVSSDAAEIRPSADAQRFEQARLSLPVAETQRKVVAYLTEKTLVLAWLAPGDTETPGYFFPYTEALIAPSASQSLARTSGGWRLDIPLGESPKTAIDEIRKSKKIAGLWASANERSREWSAPLQGGSPPTAVSVISAGKTAQQESSRVRERAFEPAGFALAVGGALLGGLILNLMPCVFPVIGLKVLSFAQTAHSRREATGHAWLFALGVVTSFLVLAGVLIGLRAVGEAVGWGFQLQSPAVVLALALLFVAIAVNLLGGFEFGLMATRLGNLQFATRTSSGFSAFASGVLAVVVASPCTAPFMGSAIGFATTAGVAQTLMVFAAVGVGMALPYVLLSAWPALLARLPRPGPWMVRFKQALAFPMLLAGGWLLWVLAQLQGAGVVLSSLVAAIALAFMLWIYGAYIQTGLARIGAWVLMLIGAITLVMSVTDSITATRDSPATSAGTAVATPAAGEKLLWQEWSPGLPERLQAQGKTVFVDFTAAWCISCQANKIRVLQSQTVIKAFESAGVVTLRADWTRRDEQISAELNRHGRSGVPLYLVYPKSRGAPKILSEWLTEREVLGAIR